MKEIIIALIFVLALFFLVSRAQGQVTAKWWYSSQPSIVSIDPRSGAMTALKPGLVQICSQPSQTVINPAQCFTVIVTQVIK